MLNLNAPNEVSFTELRGRARSYFDLVEAGGTVRVTRNGLPIADIVPIKPATASWKRNITPLTLKGLSLSDELLRDREDAR